MTQNMDVTVNTFVGNAFSLQMLSLEGARTIQVVPVTAEAVAAAVRAGATSCVGHPDTAAVLSDLLQVAVPANRVSVHLGRGDVLFVAQLTGGRLPEGSTTLPEGFHFTFVKVTVE